MSMPSGWLATLVAITLLIVGFLYHRLQLRSLRTSEGQLQSELENRTAELEQVTQKLRHVSGVDPLTQVSNHTSFQEFLRKEFRRALRDSSSVSVIMVDIDHFNNYNTRFSHDGGDACLAKVGEAIKAVVRRPGDLIARYGGEEFAIALTGTDRDGASEIARKVATSVERLGLEHPDSPVANRVTVSIGVATAKPSIDSTWEDQDLATAALRALKEAKETGRNRIVTASDPNT